MRGLVVLGCAALLGSAAWASEAERYSIDLKYDPGSSTVSAAAVVSLKPEPGARTITFYLHDELAVSAVKIGGKAAVFDQSTVPYDYSYDTKANRITVQTGGRDLSAGLRVEYHGRFSPSAERSPSDYMRGDKDGLYLRSYAYSLWFPVFAADRSSFPAVDFDKVTITAPADMRAVFVGDEIARVEKNGRARATWTARAIGPYDAQLTIGRFAVKRSNGMSTYYLKDAESEAAAARILDYADKLFAYYRSHYRQTAGERPIHLVELPKYGDIASANMVGLSEGDWRTIQPDGYEMITLAHELVHAFVQTKTPKSDPLYVLQIEGFPSYFHLPALAAILGEAWYDKKLDTVQKKYLERRATGKDGDDALPPEKPILAMSPEDVSRYKDTFVLNDRALLFWDYLRRKMARADFDALVRDLTGAPSVTAESFFGLIGTYAPSLAADAHLWLETTQYPQRFTREN
jgi:hypothetical protein